MPRKIAIVGERDPAKRAHLGIEASLALFQPERRALNGPLHPLVRASCQAA